MEKIHFFRADMVRGHLKKCMICALFIIFSGVNVSAANDIENILIICVDAMHPDALTPQTSTTIYQLMKQGAYTLDGQSTDPPLTLLAHAAMFSGLTPEQNKRTDNSWKKGEPRIKGSTIFDTAKSRGYATGFFYSKQKLGYLVNRAIDLYKFDREFSLEHAYDFFDRPGKKRLCFLHISGLDRVGPVEGWMSPGYLEALFFIDAAISSLVDLLKSQTRYLIIVTSDHAGHGTIHGSDHPDDARLPLVMASDTLDLKEYQGIRYQVTDFKSIIETLLGQ